MPNIRKYSLAILNYYKSLGIEFHIQNKQRVRFDDHFYHENKDKVLLESKLKDLKQKIINLDCELKLKAKNFVFYDGCLKSDIMIIGEAPGYEEDRLGKPFVGAAGKNLIK